MTGVTEVDVNRETQLNRDSVAVIKEMIGEYKSWTQVVISQSTRRVISVNWSSWMTTEVKVLKAELEPWSTTMRSKMAVTTSI